MGQKAITGDNKMKNVHLFVNNEFYKTILVDDRVVFLREFAIDSLRPVQTDFNIMTSVDIVTIREIFFPIDGVADKENPFCSLYVAAVYEKDLFISEGKLMFKE
jgi:hypothetical protein